MCDNGPLSLEIVGHNYSFSRKITSLINKFQIPFFLPDRRRSNVVKEIDRLKQNREARRAKQAEILEEKVTKQSIDPGNPNWEFLTMIRDYQEQLEYNPLQEGDDCLGKKHALKK